MILVMNSNVSRTTTVLFICMSCMRNYVQQETNCVAVPVRKVVFLSQASKALSLFMHL